METGTWQVKVGLAQMLKGGVIMDVVTAEHAKIAEEAGACAVMALERVPSDIRAAGGVARMADPTKIIEIMETVTIPVMAKCRIGHFVEAQVLEALGVDYIDESEGLTPADQAHHINKRPFKLPLVCGGRDPGAALPGGGGPPPARRLGRRRQAPVAPRRRADGGGEGAERPPGAGEGDAGAGPAAGRQLRGRRRRHPRRRRPPDAARRPRRRSRR